MGYADCYVSVIVRDAPVHAGTLARFRRRDPAAFVGLHRVQYFFFLYTKKNFKILINNKHLLIEVWG